MMVSAFASLIPKDGRGNCHRRSTGRGMVCENQQTIRRQAGSDSPAVGLITIQVVVLVIQELVPTSPGLPAVWTPFEQFG
jgi:hypothetical protein